MIKTGLIVFLFYSFGFLTFAQDTVVVNNTKFLFKKVTRGSEEYSGIDTVLFVYRIESGKNKLLLEHIVFQENADCNSIFRDYGTYYITNDSIIFSTVYEVDRSKNFGSPVSRKQIYIVEDSGKMILIYDKYEMEDGSFEDAN